MTFLAFCAHIWVRMSCDFMPKRKPTLLILPGWGGSSDTWKNFIALSERYFRVICINLPCFGDEPCPPEEWGVGEYAEFVWKKINQMPDVKGHMSKVVLLGHSFGGQVAVRLAADHPDFFSRLVLMGASAIRPRRQAKRAFWFALARLGKLAFYLPPLRRFEAWGRELLYRAVGTRDYAETSGVKRAVFQKIIREDLTAILPRVTMPTLVLWGAQDRYVPLRYGKKIARLIPQATLRVFPDGRHGLHLTHAEGCLNIIRMPLNNIANPSQ